MIEIYFAREQPARQFGPLRSCQNPSNQISLQEIAQAFPDHAEKLDSIRESSDEEWWKGSNVVIIEIPKDEVGGQFDTEGYWRLKATPDQFAEAFPQRFFDSLVQREKRAQETENAKMAMKQQRGQ